jgi:hypothetical protein
MSICAAGLIGAAPPAVASAAPHWSVVSQPEPTYFAAGDAADAYRLTIRNDSSSPTVRGSPVTIADTLPKGVVATKASGRGEGANGAGSPEYRPRCPPGPMSGVVTCTYEEGPTQGVVLPGATIVLTIVVSIPEGVTVLDANSVTVSGGGAPSASISEPTSISAGSVPFGLAYFTTDLTQEGGEADTQAGSHPYELTTSLAFNVSGREAPGGAESPLANASPKDVEVALPPGLLGNPTAVPQCSQQAFQEREKLNCPVDTQVGTVKPSFYGTFPSAVFPVFNVAPPPGQPAELGFTIAGVGHVPMFFHVGRSGSDSALTVSLANLPEAGPLQGVILSLWGVPADASHDLEREGTLGQGGQQAEEFCKPLVAVEGGVEHHTSCPSGLAAKPFLSLPGRCGETLAVGLFADSWQDPRPPGSFLPESQLAALTGCERLSFSPSITLAPETKQAGSPSGYTVDIHVPQSEDPSGLATPDLKSALFSLPAGVVVSPSVADGLQACSEAQFAPQSLNAASCPAASQIGTVEIVTPLLSSPLKGGVFLAQPECAPCSPSDAQQGKMIRWRVQAQGSGVTIKLEGSSSVDQHTGQLTTSFEENPQLPFEDLRLTFDGGPRAPLANGSVCGAPLVATAQLASYSGQSPAQQSSEPFELGGCPAPQFAPSFIAGTTNNQAGALSPETVTLSRTDQDQDFEALSVHTPPGLFAMLSKLTPCPEAQVQAQACGPESHIGTATVGLGPGPQPLYAHGELFLTGPHDGAPFGLSVVVAAKVGPIDLGTLALGAAIGVDPRTAALTITSDPLPQSLDGIPLQTKTISLDLDREGGVVVNPTNCRPLAITGTARSTGGSLAFASSRFQAANCATLPFKPKLTALTHAWTSKALGAYLHVKLVSGAGQANIAKLKLDLPEQLPARLSTLHQACPASVLAANPARCPAGSVVGSASALTPLLRNPLRGPVYLLSNGGAAAPVLEIVLQGEGVTLRLDGQTSIRDHIASSAFRSLPDVPLSSFDLVLDEGPHSLLAANLPRRADRSMCEQRLAMPLALTAQDGAVVKLTAKIAVSGCPKRRPARRGESRPAPRAGASARAASGA